MDLDAMTLQELFVTARLTRESETKSMQLAVDLLTGIVEQLSVGFHTLAMGVFKNANIKIDKFIPKVIRDRKRDRSDRSKAYDRGASAATQRALILASVRPQS